MLISLEPRELSRVLAKRGFFATLVDVEVDGAVHRTLPRDVQYHPATDVPLHVDFMRVGAGTQVTVTVPVAFVNQEMSTGIAPRRHPQHRAPWDRADLPGRRHPRPADRRASTGSISATASISARVTFPAGCRPTITERDFTIASIAASSAVREEAATAASDACRRPSRRRQPEPPIGGSQATSIAVDAPRSSVSAIPAPAMPATGTMSALWRPTRSRGGTASAAFAAVSRASSAEGSIAGERRLVAEAADLHERVGRVGRRRRPGFTKSCPTRSS